MFEENILKKEYSALLMKVHHRQDEWLATPSTPLYHP